MRPMSQQSDAKLWNEVAKEAIASNDPASLLHFQRLPWAAKFIDSPDYQLIENIARQNDGFFAYTINSSNTIPFCLSVCRTGLGLGLSPDQDPSSSSPTVALNESPSLYDCVWLLHLADSGLSGYTGVAHGGVTAAILDEVAGMVGNLHKPDKTIPLYTVTLDISYHSPVTLPGDYVCAAWLTCKAGRKYYIMAQLMDERGALKTQAKALFVGSRTHEKL